MQIPQGSGESAPITRAPTAPGLPAGAKQLQRAVLGDLWRHLQLQAPGYHDVSQSRCQPSPKRPPSGCAPPSPGGEHLGPGREQLPVLASAVREAVQPSTVHKAFPVLYVISRGLWPLVRCPQTLLHVHLRGLDSEVVSSLLKVTLPSAFLENWKAGCGHFQAAEAV